jgi:hypothetical protein
MGHQVNLDDDAARRQVCDWLRANGIDPARTPMHPQASIADGRLTIRQKVSRPGPNGGLADVIDPEDPNRILEETITVPVVVEPDGVVVTWLAPRCPACGR